VNEAGSISTGVVWGNAGGVSLDSSVDAPMMLAAVPICFSSFRLFSCNRRHPSFVSVPYYEAN